MIETRTHSPNSLPPLVIKIGGVALENAANAGAIWEAIARLHTTRVGGVVLVHGGGSAVDRHLARLGMETRREQGIRITPPDQAEEIAGVLAGRVNKSVVRQLNGVGVSAVGLCLGDGKMFRTTKTTKYSFDPGRVGEVLSSHGSDGALLRHLLNGQFLPVVSSIGLDDEGFLNLNADDAAAAVARELQATALILLTDVPGILDGQKNVVREITSQKIEDMIQRQEITGGMIVKARAAAETAKVTGVPVLILSGNDPGAIGEWTLGNPVGTRVVPPAVG